MRYRRGDFEVLLTQIDEERYRAEVKYRGKPLRIRKVVLDYIADGRYKYAVDPLDEDVQVLVSRTPLVVVRASWRRSKIVVSAKADALAIAADKLIEFAETYMAAYRANALDRLFHED
ncbi:MAG: hypothetical protein RXR02_07420 [Thermoproteus sp.]